jgi:CHAD domain-containing protein
MAAGAVISVPRALIAADSSIADSARLALAAGLAALKHQETAAMAGEIEPVHQMRVSLRRLRATVGLFATVIHGSRRRVYERELKWLGRAAGGLRDCDVMGELLRDGSAHIDPAFAPALAPVARALAGRRDAELSLFAQDLRTKRYQRMCELFAVPLLRRALPATDVGCYAPAMIAPIASKVRKAGKGITAADVPPALFHRLRVRVKRLRYAFEMLSGMGGKRVRRALARLEQMQELLGAHQDLVATLAWLRAYAESAEAVAPETLIAVGALMQTLGERRWKLATQTYRRWRKLSREEFINDALKEITRLAERRLDSYREAQAANARQAQAEADRDTPAAPATSADAVPDLSPNQIVADIVIADPIAPTPVDASAPEVTIESPVPPHPHNQN